MTTAQVKSDDLPLATPESTMDETALAAIRELLAGESAPESEPSQHTEPDDVPGSAAYGAAGKVTKTPGKREILQSQSLAPQTQLSQARSTPSREPAAVQKPANDAPCNPEGRIGAIKAANLGDRQTPRCMFLAATGLLILFRPLLMLGLVVLSLLVLTGAFLILGYDGFWRRAIALGRWYARRHPSHATDMHRKLDNFAMSWDVILDRFPEGTVDGLYLPDFGDLASAEARHDAVLERRFSDMQNSEA